MGGEKNLLPVIESDFNLIKQLLDFSRDSVYDDKYPMSSTVQELYQQTTSNLHRLHDYVKADIIGKMNQPAAD